MIRIVKIIDNLGIIILVIAGFFIWGTDRLELNFLGLLMILPGLAMLYTGGAPDIPFFGSHAKRRKMDKVISKGHLNPLETIRLNHRTRVKKLVQEGVPITLRWGLIGDLHRLGIAATCQIKGDKKPRGRIWVATADLRSPSHGPDLSGDLGCLPGAVEIRTHDPVFAQKVIGSSEITNAFRKVAVREADDGHRDWGIALEVTPDQIRALRVGSLKSDTGDPISLQLANLVAATYQTLVATYQGIIHMKTSELTDAQCPFCGATLSDLAPDTQLFQCQACDTPHHVECWRENRGCTTYGCGGTSYDRVKPQMASL